MASHSSKLYVYLPLKCVLDDSNSLFSSAYISKRFCSQINKLSKRRRCIIEIFLSSAVSYYFNFKYLFGMSDVPFSLFCPHMHKKKIQGTSDIPKANMKFEHIPKKIPLLHFHILVYLFNIFAYRTLLIYISR